MGLTVEHDTIEPRNYFHHCIPRFILRAFVTTPPVIIIKQKRQKSSDKYRLVRKRQDDNIFVYDLLSGILQSRGLSRVYGQFNLYRDVNNPVDIDYIENKFCLLEGQTSQVIRSIHAGLPFNIVTLSRAELATLRKFIFLMHFRSDAISATYYLETDPRNAPLADWIRQYKQTRGLTTEIDVWRDALKYYLDTSHQDIVATGERIRERYGSNRLHEMLRHGVDPELEEWYAIDYESQANYFFLGIWEAAEDSEFVLSSNGFGLWEGLIFGSPGAHRVYIVSPRIAIVLRRTFLRHPHSNDPSILYSCLANIPISKPKIQYANEDLFALAEDTDPTVFQNVLNTYRSSPQAQKDAFTFAISKLSAAETYAVNEVVMMNVNLHPSASLTFASSERMLETLRAYNSSHNTFLARKKDIFSPLLRELLAIHPDTTAPLLPASPHIPDSETETDTDQQLHMLLRFTIRETITFPSSYNRAYVIFHMATDVSSLSNSISSKIRRMVDEGTARLNRLLDPPLLDLPLVPHYRSGRIVETLPQHESNVFFSLVGYQVDQTGIGCRSNDILATVIYEAVTIGITHWLAERRMDVINDLLSPWVDLLYIA